MVLRLFDAGRRDLHLPRSRSQRLPFVAARYHLQILAAGGGSKEDLGGYFVPSYSRFERGTQKMHLELWGFWETILYTSFI